MHKLGMVTKRNSDPAETNTDCRTKMLTILLNMVPSGVRECLA